MIQLAASMSQAYACQVPCKGFARSSPANPGSQETPFFSLIIQGNARTSRTLVFEKDTQVASRRGFRLSLTKGPSRM